MASWRDAFRLPSFTTKGKGTSSLGTLPPSSRLPKIKTLPVFRRGPKELQRALLTEVQQSSIPPPQQFFNTAYDGQSLRLVISLGSAPEWAVFFGLIKNGLMPDSPDGFDYQSNKLGGRQQLGGAVLDFFIPTDRLGIDVQGVFYHYELGGTVKQAADLLQRQALASHGINVIFIDDDKALADPVGIVQKALAGIDESRAARGF